MPYSIILTFFGFLSLNPPIRISPSARYYAESFSASAWTSHTRTSSDSHANWNVMAPHFWCRTSPCCCWSVCRSSCWRLHWASFSVKVRRTLGERRPYWKVSVVENRNVSLYIYILWSFRCVDCRVSTMNSDCYKSQLLRIWSS